MADSKGPVSPQDVHIKLERMSSFLDGLEKWNHGIKNIKYTDKHQGNTKPQTPDKHQSIFLTQRHRSSTTSTPTISRTPTLVKPEKPPSPISGGIPIDLQVAKTLRMTLTGSSVFKLGRDWMRAGLVFQQLDGPFPYGMMATRSGSRGVIMCVQAFILKHLIFKYDTKEDIYDNNVLKPSGRERRDALIDAICEMIWQAGSGMRAVVTLPQSKPHFEDSSDYTPDGLTEKLCLYELHNKEDLKQFVRRHLSYFEYESHSGCLLFLYSILLSRSIEGIRQDQTQDKVQLLTNMEQCTRGLINLLLTGWAVDHLHNGNIIYDDNGDVLVEPLLGIQGRSQVGRLFWHKEEEDGKRTQVGSRLRTPKHPVWVTQINGNNFAVLFGINPELVGNWRAENRFVLHYYTGLSSQTKPAVLSIDTRYGRTIQGRTSALRRKEEQKIPALEQCIMSKYPGAEVDWSGMVPFV